MTVRQRVLLQQFARFPRRGGVKTRLQPLLGADGALALHCELMQRTSADLLACGIGPVELWLDEVASHPAVTQCLALGVEGPQEQQGRDLGERMAAALCAGLARADRVLLTGSDCPFLDVAYLRSAALALESSDVVFGPAEDGGYVLLGCRRMRRDLLQGVAWGTESTLQESEACVAAGGFSSARLALRYDIDRPEDLRRWRGAT
jgi:rSAM/selenodomain-associated transferase 1